MDPNIERDNENANLKVIYFHVSYLHMNKVHQIQRNSQYIFQKVYLL